MILPIALGLSLPSVNHMGEVSTDSFLGSYRYPVMGLTLIVILVVVWLIVNYIKREMKRLLADQLINKTSS